MYVYEYLAGRVRRLIGSLCIYILSLGCPLGVFGARPSHFGSAIGRLWGAFGPTGVSLGSFDRPLWPPWPAWGQPLDFNEKWTSLCEQTGRSAAACAQDIASRNSSPDCAPSHWAASPQPAHRIKPRVQKVDVTFRAYGPFCRSLRTKYSLAELISGDQRGTHYPRQSAQSGTWTAARNLPSSRLGPG